MSTAVQSSSPTATILRRLTPVHAFPTRYFKISLNIVLTSTPKSFKSSTIKTLHEFLLLPYVVSRPSSYGSPGNSYNQRSKHANVKIIFLHATCVTSTCCDLSRSSSGSYINKTYINMDGLLNTLKCVQKVSADIT